jgi:hypothetical protein
MKPTYISAKRNTYLAVGLMAEQLRLWDQVCEIFGAHFR